MKTVPSSLIQKSVATTLVLFTFLSVAVPAEAASSNSSSSSSSNSSASPLEISGWIPYWATDKGTADASSHISQFTEINPFGYSVKTDGTLADTSNVGSSAWQNLFKQARANDVKIVPTIMWSDTAQIYTVLSNPTLRAAHIQSIVNTVKQNGFDGVDIDYEGKSAETRDSYSAFLAELSTALNKAGTNLTLDCTIEARMPLAARYSGTPPANIEYANDLPKVNQYCDRVRIMTYDQQTADLQLNAAHKKDLYAPVSDTAWVEKVVDYMAEDIDKSKMAIGVPTYGSEYQAMSDVDGKGFSYVKTSAFNPQYALDVAKQYNITPSRNVSGELYFSYVPKEQTSALPNQAALSKLAPKGTDSGLLAAAGALAYTKEENRQAPVTFLTWSDAQAIQDKAKLAEKLGLAGIAIFKVDGGEDTDMWKDIASVAKPIKDPKTSRVINAVVPVTTPASTGTTIATPPPVTGTTAVSSTGTGSTSLVFTQDLQYGSENADVKRLQDILIQKGYMKVASNGYFGPATKAAVTAWQQASGLPATGFFGPMSRAMIAK